MRKILIILVIAALLSSCSLEIKKEITVALFSSLSWEEEMGKEMWFTVKYFDGKSVVTEYLPFPRRELTLSVFPSSLAVFVFYPLGTLSPLGGFWEEGDVKRVYVESQFGYFASMLVEAAEVMPEAVRELSVRALRKKNHDLGALERESFLSSLFKGTLNTSSPALSKKFHVPLEGVLSGNWVSLSSHSSSFTLISSGDKETLFLLPGIWYYLNKDRDLILEIVLSDNGEYYVKHKSRMRW